MNALREGFRAVQESLRSLAIYVLLLTSFSAAALITKQFGDTSEWENPLGLIPLLLHAAGALIGATAQAIAFTWMAQHLGRPLWKFSTREGIHEFFGLWLIIQTLETSLWVTCNSVAVATNDGTLGFSLLIAFMPVFVLTTPVGACIMYQGGVTTHALRNTFRILADVFPQTLVLMMFSGAALFFLLILFQSTVEWAAPFVTIIGVYVDIVVFGATWALCMYHERADDRNDDLDF